MLQIDRILIGTANFHHYEWDAQDRRTVSCADVDAIITGAASAGFAGFDAADGYGFGEAEAALGRNAAHIAGLGDMAATTKLGYNFYNRQFDRGQYVGRHFQGLTDEAVVPFDTGREFSREYLKFAAERSSHRLSGLQFNVLLHCPDSNEVRTFSRLETLAWLARLDNVREVGISVKRPEEILYALYAERLDIVQVPLASLRSHAMRLAVESARGRGVKTVVNQPFNGGTWLTAVASHVRQRWPHTTSREALNAAARALLEHTQSRDLCDFIVVGISDFGQLEHLVDASRLGSKASPPTVRSRDLSKVVGV